MAVDGIVGKVVGGNKQDEIDKDLLGKLCPERLARYVLCEEMLYQRHDGVQGDGDADPFSKLPVLKDVFHEVNCYCKWQ